MIGPRGRSLPWQAARTVPMAVITVGLSVAAHVAAGGLPPAIGPLALLTALSAVVSLPILLRWRSPAAVVPLLTAAQGALHPAFGLLTDGAGHAGHAMPGAGSWSSTMVLAHLAAGLVAATLVVLVDHLLAAAFLGRWQRPVLSTPMPDRRALGPQPIRTRPVWAAVAAALVHAAPRRGPPATTVV
ncbi:hypothetical protein [Nakamurella sp.]|uniref:hypothetical protein n=1 Tax=Nakamurella sp. TaxID=1869182 RepID=UPI003B3A871C